jgi:hypothetical protein
VWSVVTNVNRSKTGCSHADAMAQPSIEVLAASHHCDCRCCFWCSIASEMRLEASLRVRPSVSSPGASRPNVSSWRSCGSVGALGWSANSLMASKACVLVQSGGMSASASSSSQ